jgi:tyrosyl-tRNA synthetase
MKIFMLNLSVLFLLKRFQLKKYKSIIVIGGATSLVGDPSGKLDKRKKISVDKILYNQSCIKNQIIKILNVKNDNSTFSTMF